MTPTMLGAVTDPIDETTDATAGSAEELDLPVLRFLDPPPGLPSLRSALLMEVDDSGLVYELRPALDDDGTRLLVVVPTLFPDYAPVIDDDTAHALGLTTAEDALLLLVLNLGDGEGQGPTANLAAPIVVNRRTRRAAQVVLGDLDLPMRARLTA